MKQADTSAGRALLFVSVALFVFLSRLPFINESYGLDADAWGVAQAAKRIAETGAYTISRPPGSPLVEMTCSLLWRFGPRVMNGLTAAFSAIAAGFFALIMRSLVPDRRVGLLATLAFACVPVIYVNSVGALDYVWALAFLLAAVHAALDRRAVLAGLLIGAATGCRITSIGMLVPLGILLARGKNGPAAARVVVPCVLAALATAVLAYAPVWRAYGGSFLSFSDQHFAFGEWTATVLYGVTAGLWGPVGAAGIFGATLHFLFHPRRSLTNSVVPAGSAKPVVVAALAAILFYVAAYLRLPVEYAYLIPAVPFVLILFAHILYRPVFVLACAALIVSPFVLRLDPFTMAPSLSGPVFHDLAVRREQVRLIRAACERLNGWPDTQVAVIVETPILEQNLSVIAADPGLRLRDGVEVLLGPDGLQRRQRLDAGLTLYLLRGDGVRIQRGCAVSRASDGGVMMEFDTFAVTNAATAVTALDRAAALLEMDVSEARRKELRDTLLNTTFFVPGPKIESTVKRASADGSMAVLVGESGGRLFIPAFDSLDRCRAWTRELTEYTRFSGAELLELADQGYDLGLNMKTPGEFVLTPERVREMLPPPSSPTPTVPVDFLPSPSR